MDDRVIAAMARWPDVPAVFGWLSLNERGAWRLHPKGDALTSTGQRAEPDSAGEAISSPPIIAFINRNYAADDKGQWYFQNGPQRVYVRLDVAPFILHTTNPREEAVQFSTHSGLTVNHVSAWWLDEKGRLFAETEHGAGLVAGRDLEAVMARMRSADGTLLIDRLAQALPSGETLRLAPLPGGCPSSGGDRTILLRVCGSADIPESMGFIRRPGTIQPDGG